MLIKSIGRNVQKGNPNLKKESCKNLGEKMQLLYKTRIQQRHRDIQDQREDQQRTNDEQIRSTS